MASNNAGAISSTTLYVNQATGSDANNCSTPSLACASIHAVMTAATTISGAVVVDVAAGTYLENDLVGQGTHAWSSMSIVGAGPSSTIVGVGGASTSSFTTYDTTSISDLTTQSSDYGIDVLGGTTTLTDDVFDDPDLDVSVAGDVSVASADLSDSTLTGATCPTCYGLSVTASADAASADVVDSTLTGNNLAIAEAASSSNTATTDVTDSTIAGNSSSVIGHTAGIAADDNGAEPANVLITSSIVADNTAAGPEADCNHGGAAGGAITSGGDNLSVTGGGCNFSLGSDVNVASGAAAGVASSLAANGGPTPTLTISPSSPAVGNGSCTASGTNADQRGAMKPHSDGQVPGKDGTCDIGAYEYAPPVITAVTPSSGSSTGGTSVTISGAGFTLASAVHFGTTAAVRSHTKRPAGITINGDGSISTVAPAGGAGAVDVTVTNPDGTSSTGPADRFTYSSPSSSVPVIPGYDLAGSDGGVFVFPVGLATGFFGSLPGLGVKVNNIVGIVPTNNFSGYDLVGSDGGVFVFPVGQATGFFGSIPGLSVAVNNMVVTVNNIVGIVPTNHYQGYDLVGSDGGVFVFPVGQTTGFFGSLPGLGVHVNDIVGIVASPGGGGYWLVGKDGGVFTFGNAPFFGSLLSIGVAASDIVGIASTPDGNGYYIVGADGAVYAFGDAMPHGSLLGLGLNVSNIVSIVPTPDGGGYWLIGSDGGVFSFGDAVSQGSLPGLGVTVNDVIGAVPTG